MTAKKILLFAARAAGSLAACALAFAALWRYEYPQQLTQIDNLVGMIPLAFGLLFAGCICALLWIPHGRRTAALAVCLAAISLLAAALFPLAVRGNFDDAQSTRNQKKFQFEQAKADEKDAEISLGWTRVLAPASGYASRASLNPGSLIDASSSLLATITQHDDVRITFAPSDRDLGESKVTLESAVRVFTKNGKEIPAKLDYVAKSLDPSVGTRLMRAALSADHTVIPGEFVTVRLMVDVDKQAYRVPQKAVMQRPDGTYCVYVAADGKARLRTVTVGLWEGTDWIVRSGLKDGDLIITNQLLRLQEGSPIRLSANEAPTEKH